MTYSQIPKGVYMKTRGVFEAILGQEIRVKMAKGSGDPFCAFNNKYIFINLWDNHPCAQNDREHFRDFEHELSHATFGTSHINNKSLYNLFQDIPKGVVRKIFNILEDYRVDTHWNSLYFGSKKVLNEQMYKAAERLYGRDVKHPITALSSVVFGRPDLVSDQLTDLVEDYKRILDYLELAGPKATPLAMMDTFSAIAKYDQNSLNKKQKNQKPKQQSQVQQSQSQSQSPKQDGENEEQQQGSGDESSGVSADEDQEQPDTTDQLDTSLEEDSEIEELLNEADSEEVIDEGTDDQDSSETEAGEETVEGQPPTAEPEQIQGTGEMEGEESSDLGEQQQVEQEELDGSESLEGNEDREESTGLPELDTGDTGSGQGKGQGEVPDSEETELGDSEDQEQGEEDSSEQTLSERMDELSEEMNQLSQEMLNELQEDQSETRDEAEEMMDNSRNKDNFTQDDYDKTLNDLIQEAAKEGEEINEEVKEKLEKVKETKPDPRRNVYSSIQEHQEYGLARHEADLDTAKALTRVLKRVKNKTKQFNSDTGNEIDIAEYIQFKMNKNNDEIFLEEESDVGMTLALLVDTSGSMTGYKMSMAINTALTLWEAMEQIQEIDFEVYTFSGEKIDNREILYFSQQSKEELRKLASGGMTPTDKAVRYLTNLLDTKTGKKTIVIITDGEPQMPEIDDNVTAKWARYQVKYARRKGIEIFTFFISSQYSDEMLKSIFGPSYTWERVKDVEQLPKKLKQFTMHKVVRTLMSQ